MESASPCSAYLPWISHGSPAIADYGLIGDTCSAALVSRAGAIDWLCWPRFNAPAVFLALLDRQTGEMLGHFPQGFTHMSIVNGAKRLQTALTQFGNGKNPPQGRRAEQAISPSHVTCHEEENISPFNIRFTSGRTGPNL